MTLGALSKTFDSESDSSILRARLGEVGLNWR